MAPSPLHDLREHEVAPSLFPTRGSDNLVHASKIFIPKLMPLHLLKKITNGFSKNCELGSGSFGKVYKGVHQNGETIAVKLLHSSMPGLDDERFEQEFHNLTKLQHKNIVRLVGFCHETQRDFVLLDGKTIFADRIHMALCFEYMHNGSLDKYIFDEYSGHDWPRRYAIIKGICEGLKYLHEELKPPIFHLDLKPANILLDDNMMPKLADFGLSKIFDQEQTQITKSSIGTHGYLPPEYIEGNLISNKFDIFSLGVIIIKIIAGPKGYIQCGEMSPDKFVELVHKKWKNRLQETAVDEYALETYVEQVKRCIEMALCCVETDRHKRPIIGAIIEKLNKMEITNEQVLSMATSSSSPAQASLLPATSYTTQEETTNIKRGSILREHVHYTMRQLVIGLAKSVVEGAHNKAQSAIEELYLPESTRHDLVFIKNEFEIIHSSLNKVTDEEHTNNLDRVRQARELAYDLEDCIDVVVLLHTRLWTRLIEDLKVRVEVFSNRNSPYSLISNSGSKSKPVIVQQQPAPPTSVGYDTRRHHILADLTQLITNKDDADLQVISVWAADGGTGTTPIIRRCYSDPEIIQSFICRAWVNLTHPFNPREFVRSLMAHFYANSCQERKGAIVGVDVLTSMDASADLLSEFVQIVDKNRYLVVLEDVSTMAEWDSIRTFLPNRKNGSWIVVSSQKYEVASLCVGHPYQVLDLKQSRGEHSICAFLREANPSQSIQLSHLLQNCHVIRLQEKYYFPNT